MRLIETQNYQPVISECFSTDPALLSKWHIAAPNTAEACSARTIADLTHADKSFRFYTIMDESNLAGFCATEQVDKVIALSTFFIHPSYRGSKQAVWNTITSLFPNQKFVTIIYDKNRRAAKFLQKQGATLVATPIVDGHVVLVFGFNLGE